MLRCLLVLFLALSCTLVGCGDDDKNSDPAPNPEPDMPDDDNNNQPDVPDDDNNQPDMPPDMPEDEFDREWDLPVPEQGSFENIILQGIVLGPDGVLEDGQVLIAEDTIVCVDKDCTGEPEAANAWIVETQGIISPGLIDSHNHLAYNFLPEWESDKIFGNRYQWADDPSYEEHIRPYTSHRSANTHFCPAARWGELRSLLHGTTTVLGQSFARTCTSGWVRNADHDHHLKHDHMRTTIGSVRDINDEDAAGYLESFNDPDEPVTRFAVHMAEGFTENRVDEEFDSFVGRDPRNNRHAGTSLMVGGTSILIHSMALSEEQLAEVRGADAKIVWSPSSNVVLYGGTANIAKILELGITTGISPDWTPSGEDNMLDELRFAYEYGQNEGISALTREQLWKMATGDGADVVGLEGLVGKLEPGQRADITVFRRKAADPFESLLLSRSEDIFLVLIDGQAYYGNELLLKGLARNEKCETMDVCGRGKFLCLKDPTAINDWSDEGMGDVETQLINIMNGLPDAPDDEQYGRGDELLPLFECE